MGPRPVTSTASRSPAPTPATTSAASSSTIPPTSSRAADTDGSASTAPSTIRSYTTTTAASRSGTFAQSTYRTANPARSFSEALLAPSKRRDPQLDAGVISARLPLRLHEWLQLGSAAFVGVGLITTALLRLACGLFYTPLGTRPEDIGIGFQDVLVQSVSGVIYTFGFVTLTFVPVLVAGHVALYFAARLDKWPHRTFLQRSRTFAAALALLVAYMTIYLGWTALALRDSGLATVVSLIGALWLGRRLWQRSRSATTMILLGRPADRPVFGGRWAITAAITLAVTVTFTAILTIQTANSDAERAQRGNTVERRPFLPWSAIPARVEWSKSRAVAENCALFLGQSGGVTNVYVPTNHRLVTYPSALVKVSAFQAAPDCSHLPRVPSTPPVLPTDKTRRREMPDGR